MKTNLLILICFFLVSCAKTEGEFNPETKDQNIEPETIDQDVELNKVIVFDSEFSGLVDLPIDDGGEHKAHLLNSVDSDYGFYAYTPGGYDDNEIKYPLILFLHGSGQAGSRDFPESLHKVLEHGPPKLIKNNNWKPTYPSLVISPQNIEGDSWYPHKVHRFIAYLIDNYRVNTKRIYITGLSLGGAGCWWYEEIMGDDSYATALVPICARGPSSVENLLNTPIWAFHGADDTVVKPFTNNGSFQMVNKINDNGPKFKAKLTIYPEVYHNSWIRTYNSSGMGTESLEYDPFDMTIYDWMFQFRKE
jgi:predicted peptidase